MTAKELIQALDQILDDRDGEDIEVRMDVDFQKSYGICSFSVEEDVLINHGDLLVIHSFEAEEACEKYDPNLPIPDITGLN